MSNIKLKQAYSPFGNHSIIASTTDETNGRNSRLPELNQNFSIKSKTTQVSAQKSRQQKQSSLPKSIERKSSLVVPIQERIERDLEDSLPVENADKISKLDRSIRLTSKKLEIKPEYIRDRLVLNKHQHTSFNPSLATKTSQRELQQFLEMNPDVSPYIKDLFEQFIVLDIVNQNKKSNFKVEKKNHTQSELQKIFKEFSDTLVMNDEDYIVKQFEAREDKVRKIMNQYYDRNLSRPTDVNNVLKRRPDYLEKYKPDGPDLPQALQKFIKQQQDEKQKKEEEKQKKQDIRKQKVEKRRQRQEEKTKLLMQQQLQDLPDVGKSMFLTENGGSSIDIDDEREKQIKQDLMLETGGMLLDRTQEVIIEELSEKEDDAPLRSNRNSRMAKKLLNKTQPVSQKQKQIDQAYNSKGQTKVSQSKKRRNKKQVEDSDSSDYEVNFSMMGSNTLAGGVASIYNTSIYNNHCKFVCNNELAKYGFYRGNSMTKNPIENTNTNDSAIMESKEIAANKDLIDLKLSMEKYSSLPEIKRQNNSSHVEKSRNHETIGDSPYKQQDRSQRAGTITRLNIDKINKSSQLSTLEMTPNQTSKRTLGQSTNLGNSTKRSQSQLRPHSLKLDMILSKCKENKKMGEAENSQFNYINKMWIDSTKVSSAIKKYIDLQKRGTDDREQVIQILIFSVNDIMEEWNNAKKRNLENFLNDKEMKKFKDLNFQNSLFLTYLGKKQIWMPPKFKVSKKSGVAESFDQLY